MAFHHTKFVPVGSSGAPTRYVVVCGPCSWSSEAQETIGAARHIAFTHMGWT